MESSAWISRTRPIRSRTLRLWTWPMKSQVNASPKRSCFSRRASVRFSPTRVTPPSRSASRSAASTYFVAARISTSGPTASRTRARLRATTAGSSTEHPHHALAAGDPTVAPVREEALAPADRALARDLHIGHAGALERPPRCQPQVGPAVADDVLAEAVAQDAGDILPHLVAARPRSGPDRCGRTAADDLHATLDDAGHEPPPAGVQHGQPAPVLARDRNRDAVRR